MSESATWFVLGASSAIGRAFARAVAVEGVDVVLAGRDMEDMERTASDIRIGTGCRAEVVFFDAAATGSHAAFAAAAGSRAGTLNIVLVFASMPEQPEMDSDAEKALGCVTATYLGAVSILHRLAPYLEEKRKGIVIGIGSVAGDRGRLKNYVYGSAKAGLQSYLAGLRNRLARKGVHVVTVKPGFVDTAMTWGTPGLFLVAQPDCVARISLAAAAKGKNVVYVPWFWKWIMFIIRCIPEAIFKRLSF